MATDPFARMDDLPSKFTAGETISWKWNGDQYDNTYELKYFFSGLRNNYQFQVTSTIESGRRVFDLLEQDAVKVLPGEYVWIAKVSKNGKFRQVGSGSLRVLPSPEGTMATSHARKVVDAIESLIEGRAGNEVQNLTVNGRTITEFSTAELLKLHTYYKGLLETQNSQLKVALGKRSRRNVHLRFGNH